MDCDVSYWPVFFFRYWNYELDGRGLSITCRHPELLQLWSWIYLTQFRQHLCPKTEGVIYPAPGFMLED